MSQPQSPARRLTVAASALLATGLLVGSVAPTVAAPALEQTQGMSGAWPHHSQFNRHFWRGSQHSRATAPQAEMNALADEAEPIDEAMSYCANRFRSYDHATGTYLGYDGHEHPCP